MAPLIVHHLNNSRSQRILWLCEELGINYEIKHYKRGADLRAPKELRDVHPLGKSPVITTEEGEVIGESGTIIEYLISRYGNGRFVPAPSTTSPKFNVADSYWSHFAEASFMPVCVMKLVFSVVPTQAPFLVRPLVSAICSGVVASFVDPELKKLMGFVQSELDKKGGGWFAGGDSEGNPTLADFQMLFPLEAFTSSPGRAPKGFEISDTVKTWVARAHERPAYKRALEKGGPYDYA